MRPLLCYVQILDFIIMAFAVNTQGISTSKTLFIGGLQVVLMKIAPSSKKLDLRTAQLVRMVLDFKKLESARHVSSLKQAVVRRGHPSYFGIQENVEHRIDDVSYLLLPAVIIDDDLTKLLKIFQIVAHKAPYRFGHSTHQGIVTRDLALSKNECLIADVANPHKSQQLAEKFPSLWKIEMLIVFFAADQWRRVYCMM